MRIATTPACAIITTGAGLTSCKVARNNRQISNDSWKLIEHETVNVENRRLFIILFKNIIF